MGMVWDCCLFLLSRFTRTHYLKTESRYPHFFFSIQCFISSAGYREEAIFIFMVMKKLLFFVLTAALMFGCKKDDNAPTLPATDTTLPKKIVKVISTYEEPDFEAETTTEEFSYDESGRLIRIITKYQTTSNESKYKSTITYAEDQVTLTETDLQEGGGTDTHTCLLYTSDAADD